MTLIASCPQLPLVTDPRPPRIPKGMSHPVDREFHENCISGAKAKCQAGQAS